ncbi:hypothetical protein F4820DRAFT_21829 [Hypoxylon rubiginosum]|uniref:Uncharacterized protein n=1 Tax=Hypoxylon rubiginosum TaxID=110542 RepID=A0ACB9YTT3_9PEZI|nr:hypothetical protein F4820DRAFT_21829 [Hypoxylon rubiginosum]
MDFSSPVSYSLVLVLVLVLVLGPGNPHLYGASSPQLPGEPSFRVAIIELLILYLRLYLNNIPKQASIYRAGDPRTIKTES